MNRFNAVFRILKISAIGAVALVFTACSSQPPQKNPAVEQARTSLTNLQSDPNLASLAPIAIRDAETAVRAAENVDKDPPLEAHLAYLANNRVAIARAQAEARYAEDQVKSLSDQRERVLLASQSREADQARARAAQLERELEELKQKQTERGTVFTMSDALFATGQADLRPGAQANLDRLAAQLNQHPDRRVVVEGHTDSTGSESLNAALSQRRAEAVRNYLVSAGVSSNRVTAIGKGQGFPVASNDTAEGRQQNRRVEVILE